MPRGSEWHAQRPEWMKLHRGFFFSDSHEDWDATTTGIMARLLYVANRKGRQRDGSGLIVNAAREPLRTDEELAKAARCTLEQVNRALVLALGVGTLERRDGGVLAFPNLRKWQENPSAKRQREYRARQEDPSGERYSDGHSNGHSDPQRPEARSQRPEDQKPEAGGREEERDPAVAGSSRAGGSSSRRSSYREQIDAICAHWFGRWKERHPRSRKVPRYAPGDPEYRKIVRLLRSGKSVEELCEAIDGCFLTPWNQGENPQGREYLSIGLIFRDDEHVTNYLGSLERARARGGCLPSRTTTKEDQNAQALEQWGAVKEEQYARQGTVRPESDPAR